MRGQTGFTMIELMVAIAVLSILSIAVVTSISGQRNERRLQTVRAEMTAIARMANDYRRLRDSSGDDYAVSGSVDVATLNERYGVGLPLENPWGTVYQVTAGPVSAIVRTVVPVKASPPGFRVTSLSGDQTRLERQHIGRSGSRYTRRIRLIKKQIYLQDSR